MPAAVAAILEGMPEPRDLRMHEHDGRCVITAGSTVLFDYAAGDVVMRNIALAALRQLGFRGRVVAAVLGLTENYVATLLRGDGRTNQVRRVERPCGPHPLGERHLKRLFWACAAGLAPWVVYLYLAQVPHAPAHQIRLLAVWMLTDIATMISPASAVPSPRRVMATAAGVVVLQRNCSVRRRAVCR